MPRAFRPTGAPPTRTAQGDSCQSEPRKLAQGPGHRQGSSGKMAATGYFARSRWMPNRPHRTRRSRVHCTQKRKFSTSTKAMDVDVEPAKKPAKKTRWGLRPGRSILPWECGSGARRPHARSKPEAPPHVWVLPGGGGRPTRFQRCRWRAKGGGVVDFRLDGDWKRRGKSVRLPFFSPRPGRRSRRWPHLWGQPMPGGARSIGPGSDAFRAGALRNATRDGRRVGRGGIRYDASIVPLPGSSPAAGRRFPLSRRRRSPP